MDDRPTWENLTKKYPGLENPPEPVSESVLAQHMKNTEKARLLLKDFKAALKSAPYFLCSTHGEYDIKKTVSKRIVPPNTYILEAQSIGDLSLETIDSYIWEILQSRNSFLKYIIGNKNNFKKHTIYYKYLKLMGNFILYKPGDEIYERILNIGDVGEHWANMGFYRFDKGAPHIIFHEYGEGGNNILPNLRRQLVKDYKLKTTNCDLIDAVQGINPEPKFISGEPIEEDFRINDNSTKVFIFSSCAGVSNDSSKESIQRWTEIAKVQQERILESWAMGLHSLGGGLGKISKKALMPSILKGEWNAPYYNFSKANNDLHESILYESQSLENRGTRKRGRNSLESSGRSKKQQTRRLA
jgi:hypothetical protein